MVKKMAISATRHSLANRTVLVGGVSSLLGLALFLAWISSGFQSFDGWSFFLAALSIGAGMLWIGWQLLSKDRQFNPSAWLAALLLGTAFLRLVAGVVWYVALPVWGHSTPVELAGYVMADAHSRDLAAWDMASSGLPLLSAFQEYNFADQYGGMLFLSALVYRFIGGDTHMPLMMVVLAASVSALSVPLTWAFSRRIWDERIAWLAAWFMAIYPETVLLGSSQMREAFTTTLVIAAFYGLVRYFQDRSLTGLTWVLASSFLCLPFSPAFAGILLGMLVLLTLAFGHGELKLQRRFLLFVGGLATLAISGIWVSWGQIAPEGVSNPLAVITWWIRESVEWQVYLSERSSGWIQFIFQSTPAWMDVPLLVAYGVVRPFLPAALIAPSESTLWQLISIWRSVGWAFLLPFLIFAPLAALRLKYQRNLVLALCLIIWLGILVASFRGGGDMWDNPRYRATFSGLQVTMVAWVWVDNARRRDPWLKRFVIGSAIAFAWFLPWYLVRYFAFQWPVNDPFKTLGLGVASALLFVLWDWSRGNPS